MNALITVRGKNEGVSGNLVLKPDEYVVVGRDSKVGLHVGDSGISRHHCIIVNKGDQVLVTDMGSANGTYLNDYPVISAHLNDGDRVRVGDTTLEISLAGKKIEKKARATIIDAKEAVKKKRLRRSGFDTAEKLVSSAAETEERLADADGKYAFKNLHVLYNISGALAGQETLEDVLNRVCEEILGALPAQRVVILLRGADPGSLDPVAVRGRAGDEESPLSISRSVVDEVLKKDVSVLSQDASQDRRFRKRSIIALQLGSIMCVPIEGKHEVLGVVYADTTEEKAFDDRDLDLLGAIGYQAGLAIERAQLLDQFEKLFISTIRTLVAAVETKDLYTRGHSERVTRYALSLWDMVGSGRRQREVVEMAGLLHDVGKIGIPESILNKPANLDEAETEVIKRHPLLGERIVLHIKHPYIDEVAEAVRAHHELWDGTGYPRRLKGEEIPLVARVLAICDTFDAMTSDRAYRKALDTAEAIRRIRDATSTRFDPNLVEAFADAAERGMLELDTHDSRYIASQYPDPLPDDENGV